MSNYDEVCIVLIASKLFKWMILSIIFTIVMLFEGLLYY